MGEPPRKENTFNVALGFMAGRESGKNALVLLLFRGAAVLAGGPRWMVHFPFPVQHLLDAICFMSLFINGDLYDVD